MYNYKSAYSSVKLHNTISPHTFIACSTDQMAGPSVDSLFPAIAQSFVIIIIGFGFGFFNLISPKDTKTIGTLIGNLFLPALLFKNLATLNLSSVSWPFLGGMLVAKFSVFLGVAILTVILTRRVGTAGLFGIFATQSNDFALGLPIGELEFKE